MERLDLHVHTRASDGQLAPAAVVRAARAGRLDVIAITDHDTAAGVPEALEAGAESGVRVVAGIEVSADWEGEEVHILGYGIDPHAESILDHQRTAVGRRRERMSRMIARVAEMGAPVSMPEVEAIAGSAVVLARPHLARALLQRGYVRSIPEAFDRFLGDGRPGCVESALPSAVDAIGLIVAAGGIPVWAHPPLGSFDRVVRALAPQGLRGVEALRPNTPPIDSLLYEETARHLGMVVTGGSDWHGPHRADLGEYFVRPEQIAGFLATLWPASPAAVGG